MKPTKDKRRKARIIYEVNAYRGAYKAYYPTYVDALSEAPPMEVFKIIKFREVLKPKNRTTKRRG